MFRSVMRICINVISQFHMRVQVSCFMFLRYYNAVPADSKVTFKIRQVQ